MASSAAKWLKSSQDYNAAGALVFARATLLALGAILTPGQPTDDHAVVLEGLAALIDRQSDMEIVAQASDGRAAVEHWRAHRPDVTLLDLRMPRLDGVAAIQELRQSDASVRVIVLTTYDNDEQIYQALTAGAKGYLLKDARREELLDCIRRVHAGQTCVDAAIAAKLAERVSGESLSAREREVLLLMAQGQSNREIAAQLFISETTVKSHIKHLFAKLNVFSRTQAIAVAAQNGLIEI